MPNNDPLYELIRTVAGPAAGGGGSLSEAAAGDAGGLLADAVARNTAQLGQLQSVFLSQTAATAENTQAVSANTTTVAQSAAASAAANIARTVAGAVTSGFMMNPVVSGLIKLFGGGSPAPVSTPLEKYSLPDAVRLDAGVTAGVASLLPLSYGQNGAPRVAAPSVTVQVNAMDSRSFLDRSEDIANAVKRAMLESSSLNDVVSEL
jgi:hypothetical protein